MKKKICLIQPTYRDNNNCLLKGDKLYIVSLALPAVGSAVPGDWEKEFCYEYFENVNYDTDASVIGISSMGYEIFRGVELADEFRRRGKTVIFGGFQPHISTAFVEGHCDSIIHGNPGTSEMSGILRDFESHTLEKEYFCKTDLNYRIDYSSIDTRRLSFVPVVTSVGCRNSCDYCCVASIYKGRYSLRNLDHVLQELEHLHRTTRSIAFVDTNFYNNRDYVKRLCNAMIERDFRFVWGAQCTIDIGDDRECLELLQKAGCRVLFIGMESINQRNLDSVSKKYNAASYHRKLESIHSAGIKVAAFFIYGMDEDTTGTAAELSRFIIDNHIALPMLNILVPTPGSKIHARLEAEGRITMRDELDFLKNNIAYNSSFNLCFYIPKNMTAAQVEEGFLELLGRLSGYRQIIKRSISRHISLSMYLLYMNWSFRREYVRLKALRARLGRKSVAVKEDSQQVAEAHDS